MTAGSGISAGSVYVSIKADLSPFRAQMAGLQKQVQSIGRGMNRSLLVPGALKDINRTTPPAIASINSLSGAFLRLSTSVQTSTAALMRHNKALTGIMSGSRALTTSATAAVTATTRLASVRPPSGWVMALEKFNKNLYYTTRTAHQVAQGLLIFGGAAVAGVAASARSFIKFDEELIRTQLITNATTGEYEALRAKAKELGATTAFTAGQVVAGMRQLAQGGQNVAQVLGTIEPALDFARIADIDVSSAAKQMVRIANVFKLLPQEVAGVADTLAKTSTRTSTDASLLATGFSYVAQASADAGQSVKSTAALLGILSNNMQLGGKGGRALNQAFAAMAKNSDKIKELFNVDVKDAQGNFRDIIDIAADLNKATANMGSADRAEALGKAFGVLGKRAIQGIMNSIDELRSLNKELDNSGGFARDYANRLEQSLGGAYRRVLAAIENVAITLTEVLEPSLRAFLEESVVVLRQAAEWLKTNKELVVTFVKFAGTMFAAGIAVKALAYSLSILRLGVLALLGLKTAFLFVFSPIGLIIGAVIALGVVFYKFSDAGKKALTFLASGLGWLYDAFVTTFKTIVALIGNGQTDAAVQLLWAKIELRWAQGANNLKEIWEGTLLSMKNSLGNFESARQNIIDRMARNVLELAAQGGLLSEQELYAAQGFIQEASKERQKQNDKDLQTAREEAAIRIKASQDNIKMLEQQVKNLEESAKLDLGKPEKTPVDDITTALEDGAAKFKENFSNFVADSGLEDAFGNFEENLQADVSMEKQTSLGFTGGQNPLEQLGSITLKNDREIVKEQKITNALLKRISENVGQPAVFTS